MEKRISRFIQGQTVATVSCVSADKKPYTFSCFYAFDETKMQLYFKSNASTQHIELLKDWPFVSGAILPANLNPLALQGIQFSGLLINWMECSTAKAVYHRRYPFARAMSGDVYTIELDWIKMTDNSLGFGTKLVWKKPLVAAS